MSSRIERRGGDAANLVYLMAETILRGRIEEIRPCFLMPMGKEERDTNGESSSPSFSHWQKKGHL